MDETANKAKNAVVKVIDILGNDTTKTVKVRMCEGGSSPALRGGDRMLPRLRGSCRRSRLRGPRPWSGRSNAKWRFARVALGSAPPPSRFARHLPRFTGEDQELLLAQARQCLNHGGGGHASTEENIWPSTRIPPCNDLAGSRALAGAKERSAGGLALSPPAPGRTLHSRLLLSFRLLGG